MASGLIICGPPLLLTTSAVENVVRALFRMTRRPSQPLFQTLATSNVLLLHFRFTVSSFLSALLGYVFDVAIGANFDTFLLRLSPDVPTSNYRNGEPAFDDIYSLAAYHSAVLDDILGACLLRSGQRAVGDLLRKALESILDFGILVGRLYRKQVKEHEAAQRMERLFCAFRNSVQALASFSPFLFFFFFFLLMTSKHSGQSSAYLSGEERRVR